MAIIFSCSNILLNKEEKRLQINTMLISLADTPATNEYPPALLLLILCLITANITGPTDILNSKPSVMPLINGLSIDSGNVTKKL